MVFVAALGGKMQHIAWICLFPVSPICDIFPKTASNLRIIANHVVFTQAFQTSLFPIPHGDHHLILKHLEMSLFCEVDAFFPSIAKPIRPFARMAIFLVPNVFFRPEPSLLAQC